MAAEALGDKPPFWDLKKSRVSELSKVAPAKTVTLG